jgi:iron complex outermembrane recepter protein
VSELYQGSVINDPVTAGKFIISNPSPNLKPEQSWTTEWSAERELAGGQLRNTFFYENTKDALYSQAIPNVTPVVNTVQNVDEIRTLGLEIAYAQNDVLFRGLNLNSSLTFADSRIVKNANFIASEGKYQPRVPKWRANLLASYAQSEKLNYTLGIRYSSTQFGTLDNSDPNGFSYTGFSKFLVADVRVRYRFDRQFSGSIGIDNLNNEKYWAFHPYTQRTVLAELKWDL